MRFLHFLIEFVRVHTDHDDSIQVALLGQRQITFIGVRRGNQNVIALLAGIEFNAAQDLAVKAVLKHQPVAGLRLRNHNANQLGIPHTQSAGIEVWYIIQLRNGILDTLLRLI